MQIKTKIVSCLRADSKPVKQEVNGTVILPPLVFPGCPTENDAFKWRGGAKERGRKIAVRQKGKERERKTHTRNENRKKDRGREIAVRQKGKEREKHTHAMRTERKAETESETLK